MIALIGRGWIYRRYGMKRRDGVGGNDRIDWQRMDRLGLNGDGVVE
jgi:hypothetical protein